ncbi:hypothetical protein ACJX0J_011315, partial [Zea mays]
KITGRSGSDSIEFGFIKTIDSGPSKTVFLMNLQATVKTVVHCELKVGFHIMFQIMTLDLFFAKNFTKKKGTRMQIFLFNEIEDIVDYGDLLRRKSGLWLYTFLMYSELTMYILMMDNWRIEMTREIRSSSTGGDPIGIGPGLMGASQPRGL